MLAGFMKGNSGEIHHSVSQKAIYIKTILDY